MIEPELLQRRIERAADGLGAEILVPDFCGDMQVLAGNAGGGNRRADRFLIAVHLGGVEMPVAEPQRAFDRGAAGVALHAEGAEPEPGQAYATSWQILGLQMFHDDSGTGKTGECLAQAASTGISLRGIDRY